MLTLGKKVIFGDIECPSICTLLAYLESNCTSFCKKVGSRQHILISTKQDAEIILASMMFQGSIYIYLLSESLCLSCRPEALIGGLKARHLQSSCMETTCHSISQGFVLIADHLILSYLILPYLILSILSFRILS